MRLWIASIALACAACGTKTIPSPAPASARSAILLVEGARSGVYASDASPEHAGLPVEVDTDAALWMLYYDRTLAELAIPSGPLDPVAADQIARPLPRPDVAFNATVLDREASPWLMRDASDSTLFTAFRFAAEDPRACFERGGCYSSGSDPECKLDCTPRAPEPPDFEVAPEFPRLAPCVPGWFERGYPFSLGTFMVCEAALFGGTCPEDQLALPKRNGCMAIAEEFPCPPPGEFPDGVAGVFVRAGATNGDGSRALPFGRITDALGADQLVLAAGTYTEDLSITHSATITGGCAKIRGTVAIESGVATLRALALEGELRVASAAVLNEVAVRGSIAVEEDAKLSAYRLRAGDELVLAPGSNAVLEEVSLTGSITATSATITLSSFGLIGARIRLDSSVAELDDGKIFAGVARAIDATKSKLRLRDVSMEDLERPASDEVRVNVDGGRFDADRVFITGACGALALRGAATASISDVVFDSGTMDESAIHLFGASASGSRWAMAGARYAVALDDDQRGFLHSKLAIEDLSAGATIGGIFVGGASALVGRRVAIDARVETGLVAEGMRSSTPFDVDLSELRVTTPGGGLRIEGEQRVRVRRAVLRAEGTAIQMGRFELPSTPNDVDSELDAADVEIVGMIPRISCSTDLDCTGRVVINTGKTLLDAFTLTGPDLAAVVIQANEDVTLSRGVIHDVPVAFGIYERGPDLRSLMLDTRLMNVAKVCNPCPE